jgi:hypothetical protein
MGQGVGRGISIGTHESEKLTKKAIRIDTDKVDAQNLMLVTVFLNDNFRMNTCKGRLIAQINNVVINAIKTNSKTNPPKPNLYTICQ